MEIGESGEYMYCFYDLSCTNRSWIVGQSFSYYSGRHTQRLVTDLQVENKNL